MLADPTSLSLGATITPSGGTAKSMPRIGVKDYGAEYQSSDGLYRLKVSHSRGSRLRSEFRIDTIGTYTNPSTGLASEVTATAYVVINRPLAGFTNTQLKDVLFAACAFCGVTANADKILGLES